MAKVIRTTGGLGVRRTRGGKIGARGLTQKEIDERRRRKAERRRQAVAATAAVIPSALGAGMQPSPRKLIREFGGGDEDGVQAPEWMRQQAEARRLRGEPTTTEGRRIAQERRMAASRAAQANWRAKQAEEYIRKVREAKALDKEYTPTIGLPGGRRISPAVMHGAGSPEERAALEQEFARGQGQTQRIKQEHYRDTAQQQRIIGQQRYQQGVQGLADWQMALHETAAEQPQSTALQRQFDESQSQAAATAAQAQQYAQTPQQAWQQVQESMARLGYQPQPYQPGAAQAPAAQQYDPATAQGYPGGQLLPPPQPGVVAGQNMPLGAQGPVGPQGMVGAAQGAMREAATVPQQPTARGVAAGLGAASLLGGVPAMGSLAAGAGMMRAGEQYQQPFGPPPGPRPGEPWAGPEIRTPWTPPQPAAPPQAAPQPAAPLPPVQPQRPVTLDQARQTAGALGGPGGPWMMQGYTAPPPQPTQEPQPGAAETYWEDTPAGRFNRLQRQQRFEQMQRPEKAEAIDFGKPVSAQNLALLQQEQRRLWAQGPAQLPPMPGAAAGGGGGAGPFGAERPDIAAARRQDIETKKTQQQNMLLAGRLMMQDLETAKTDPNKAIQTAAANVRKHMPAINRIHGLIRRNWDEVDKPILFGTDEAETETLADTVEFRINRMSPEEAAALYEYFNVVNASKEGGGLLEKIQNEVAKIQHQWVRIGPVGGQVRHADQMQRIHDLLSGATKPTGAPIAPRPTGPAPAPGPAPRAAAGGGIVRMGS